MTDNPITEALLRQKSDDWSDEPVVIQPPPPNSVEVTMEKVQEALNSLVEAPLPRGVAGTTAVEEEKPYGWVIVDQSDGEVYRGHVAMTYEGAVEWLKDVNGVDADGNICDGWLLMTVRRARTAQS